MGGREMDGGWGACDAIETETQYKASSPSTTT